MSRHSLPILLCASVLLGTSVSQAVVTVTDFTWTGTGDNSDVTNTSNWSGTPANGFLADGSTTLENLIFPDFRSTYVYFPSNVDIYGLNVTGHYHFNGSVNLTLGAGGLTFSSSYPTHLAFEYNLGVNVTTDQTWNIGQDARVEFYESAFLSGTGKITKTGAGALDLGSANQNETWTGGLHFNEGIVILRPGFQSQGTTDTADDTYFSRSLGAGTVTVGPGTANGPVFHVYDWSNSSYSSYGDEVVVANNFILNGVFNSKNEAELILNGSVTLKADTTFRTDGSITVIEGPIGEADDEAVAGVDSSHKLIVDSTSAIVLSGSSGWTGGTEVTKGILIFAGDTPNLPASGSILVGTQGYVGIGVDNSIAGFIGMLDTASTGTIGFDSDVEVSLDHFNAPINLSGFAPGSPVRLGTATAAVLDTLAVITPQGTDYRFGGGGGTLTVASQLTGARNLVLDSPSDLPLTVRLINATNNFTGTVNVTNSGLVFGDNSTAETFYLPAGTYTMNSGSYIGTEDSDVTPATFFSHFSAGTAGIIGFDIGPTALSPRTIADLSMAGFGSAYVGTSSFVYSSEFDEITGPGLHLTGTIAPNSDNVHRFAAYKGGALEVAGALTGSSMIIGHPDSLGAFGDRTREEYSTVLISGNNGTGLAGGTTLHGGRLMLGHNQALGSGTLTVAPVTFSLEEEDGPEIPAPLLSAYGAGITVSNPIVLNAPELNIGGDDGFTIAGIISGPGELYVGEESDYGFTLTLSGANTYGGGTYISNGATLIADHNNALGSGPLGFGSSSLGSVVFNTAAPVINGLDSYDYGYLNFAHSAPVLTINQTFNGNFNGQFSSNNLASDSLRVVKEGPGTLFLNEGGLYYHNGVANADLGGAEISLQINSGTLVLGNNFYIEDSTPTIWVHGGTLALSRDPSDYYDWINNPIVVDNGGRLAGYGAFNSNVAIGTGAILSPGLADAGHIGFLQFDHLELNTGGILEWQIQSMDSTSFIHDFVHVGLDALAATLVVNAGTAHDDPLTVEIESPTDDRFTLKIISLSLAGAPGALDGFDPSQSYSWAVFSFDALTGFDPAKFKIDADAFLNSLAFDSRGNGGFSLSMSGSETEGGALFLNFTPVPEPSTYALMALGLGFIGLTVWRKSRRSI